MEEFKIAIFYKENPGKKFPDYTALDDDACADIRNTLSENLGLDITASDELFVHEIDRRGKICEGYDCEEDGFSLKKLLSAYGVECCEYVFINWYRFDKIDKILFSELAGYFDYIWYPAADDIDIFDETFSWVLSVSHHGQAKILNI